ncbi:MAG: TonB-dependent receptor plug domain-containing protein [Ignavibacteriae bacterium]|nr:hypothetical protein [Ignavibacteriota bacterium]NOG98796.1 TonB-dependent receptor plug domain-containing protein [Ignavibacteriota bacterium]
MKNNILTILVLILISLNLFAQQNEDGGFNDGLSQVNIYFTQSDIRTLADRNLNSILSFYPGVDFRWNNLYIRGSNPEANVYIIDGIPFNFYDGDAVFRLPFQTWESINLLKSNLKASYGYGENVIEQNIRIPNNELNIDVEYLTDNVSLKSRGNSFDGQKRFGAHWFGYSNFNASVTAPIYKDHISLFGNVNYQFHRDKSPQNYPGIDIGPVTDLTSGDVVDLTYPAGSLLKNSLETYNFTGKVLFNFNPFRFDITGHYSDQLQFDPFNNSRVTGNIANLLNTFRIEEEKIQKYFINATFSHQVSEVISYDIKASYSKYSKDEYDPILKNNFLGYGDSVANADAGVFWVRGPSDNRGRFQQPSLLNLFDFLFNPAGKVVSGYNKFSDERLYFAGHFLVNTTKQLSIQLGLEYTQNEIRKLNYSNQTLLSLPAYLSANNFLNDNDPFKVPDEQIYINRGVNNFGYDFMGDESDGGTSQDFSGPQEPSIFSASASGEYYLKNFIFSAGLRLDNYQFDTWKLKDPTRPELSFARSTGEILPEGILFSESTTELSPRINIEYFIRNQYGASLSFNQFSYSPNLYSSNNSLNFASHQLRSGSEITLPVAAADALPIKTTNLDLSFNYNFNNYAFVQLVLFYKDLQNLQLFNKQNVAQESFFSDYNILTQNGSLIIRGIEFEMAFRIGDNFGFNGNSTFQTSNNFGIYIPEKINLLYFYNFVNDKNLILNKLKMSLQFIYNSGRKFVTGSMGPELEGDARDRQPISPIDDNYLPYFFQVNFKIDKRISISELFKINVYLDVINLFDTKNLLEAFLRTGTDDDDGYLSSARGGQLIETFGPIYEKVYRAMNIDYKEQFFQAYNQLGRHRAFYGPPRQIRFGIRLEY